MPRSRLATVLAAAVALSLGFASQAFAGTITYAVPPGPLYTVQDNGNGIVKLTYNGCVTAGARQTLSFAMTTTVTATSPATFSVLKAEGLDPTTDFTPNPVDLVAGAPQNFNITIGFTLPSANNGITTFRIKLDPASGEGLGQGAGIMVRVPCVLAAAPAPGTLASTPVPATANAPAGTPATAAVATPTAGVFATLGSSLAQRPARCIAVPQRLRVRARQTTGVRVRVTTNGENIEGARLRVTLPGGQQLFRRTGTGGIANILVRPRRAGTLIIQSDVCFGSERFAVLAARAASAGTAPARFTG